MPRVQTCVAHFVRNSLRSAAKEGLAQNHEKASRGLYRSDAWCCGNIIRGVRGGVAGTLPSDSPALGTLLD